MQSIWKELEIILSGVAPSVVTTLNEPATKQEIVILEDLTGYSLPAELKEYLSIHNGQNDPSRLETLCEEGTLLPVGAIVETYNMLNEINESGDLSDGEWWNRKFLPLTDGEGDHLSIDLESGELVMHVHDSEIEYGIANTLTDWFREKLSVFKEGRYKIDDGFIDYWVTGS
ncbi:SMI1/KNR4 family protein [Endozoicomonas sp. OPT23]|uniref:SMI1/KNR4 family protein n=1 Tax=Endozoicomonas sp. OPT23 TaxID=2072845 RepID=UPI00189142CC|nr:SMI1/KNR4 family protein [Endozoicomonas sp. OPT23]